MAAEDDPVSVTPPRKVVKKVVKKVVRKVKKARKQGCEDDDMPAEGVTPPKTAEKRERSDDEKEESSSSGDDADLQARRRSSLRNYDVMERFIDRKSEFYVEAEAPEARETPLISEKLQAALDRRLESLRVPSTPKGSEGMEGGPSLSFSNSEHLQTREGALDEVVKLDDVDVEAKEEINMPMWCTRKYTHPNRYVRLHDEVVDLVKYLRPTEEEDLMRKKVILDLTDIVKTLFPGCSLVSFGSIITGLVLPTSDVDVTVMWDELRYCDPHQRERKIHQCLDTLASHIAAKGMCEEAFPTVIKKTKVPLVKFTHKETWIDVDISFDAPDGRVNSELVVQYLKEYPISQPLIMVIKYFLQQRSMNEPYTGGLGSYAVTLMVVSFLQHHDVYLSRNHQAYGIGSLLVDFFRLYGVLFEYNSIGISVKDGRYFRKEPMHYTMNRGSMYLEDPQNRENNVTSSTRQMTSIQASFHHAFLALTSTSFPPCPGSEQSAEHPMISKRPTILSRVVHIDRAMLDRRNKVRLAYERWREKEMSPEQRTYEYLQRFEDEQVSGDEIRRTLSQLGVSQDDDVFVL